MMIADISSSLAADPISWIANVAQAVAQPDEGFVTPERRTRAMRKLLDQLRRHHAPTADRSVRLSRVLMAIWDRAPDAFADAETMLLAGALHDIGKLFVPANTLDAARPLSAEEMHMVQRHPEMGAQLLGTLGFQPLVIAAAQDHHERREGGGYPSGQPSSGTHPVARLVAVADSFLAMVDPRRAYRPALGRAEALAEVERCRGKQFDPAAADLLISTFSDSRAAHFELAIL